MYECERRRGIKRKIFTVLLFIIAVACTACAFAACFGTHTLKYLANKGGYVDGETMQYVRDGEDGTAVTAVADYGYEFVGWSDGVAEASRTDSGVKKDIKVSNKIKNIKIINIFLFILYLIYFSILHYIIYDKNIQLL